MASDGVPVRIRDGLPVAADSVVVAPGSRVLQAWRTRPVPSRPCWSRFDDDLFDRPIHSGATGLRTMIRTV